MKWGDRPSRRRVLQTGLVAAIGAHLPGPSRAQAFQPPKSATMVCPYPPGGLGDATARIVARGLSDLWKVPVVVDNKSGATGMIGAASVVRGPGDGSVLLCMLPEALSVAKALNAPIDFDVQTDLQPVALPVVSGCVLGVNAQGRFATYQDLVAYARANPEKLNFGVQGIGSAFHLAAERWALAEGIRITTVPYRGGAPALLDLLGGSLDVMFLATSLGLPYFQDNRLRPLAVASLERIQQLGEVKTLNEMGLDKFDVPITLGVFAPKAAQPAVTGAVNRDIQTVMGHPDAQAWMKSNIVATTRLTPEDFRERMAREIAVFSEVAARANIRLR